MLVIGCTFLLAYGLFAFFGQAGGLHFVGESFEWPLVWGGDAVENTKGERFAPILAPGRIQVYDSKNKFLRGWFIPASGGTFKLHIADNDNLEVFTARGHRRLAYDASGTLLSEGQFQGDYVSVPTGPVCHVDRKGPWYLWPLAHPVLAMVPGFVGLIGLGALFNRRQANQAGRAVIVHLHGAAWWGREPPVSRR